GRPPAAGAGPRRAHDGPRASRRCRRRAHQDLLRARQPGVPWSLSRCRLRARRRDGGPLGSDGRERFLTDGRHSSGPGHTSPSDHYTIISSDSHAGASHAAYREYLDPAYLEDFDAWRNKYKNPYKDLAPGDDRRKRNWDDEMRNAQQEADGVVGEVVFPNTVP